MYIFTCKISDNFEVTASDLLLPPPLQAQPFLLSHPFSLVPYQFEYDDRRKMKLTILLIMHKLIH